MRRPADLFDRVREWEALDGFVRSDSPGSTLAIVSGRRRQGKTFLLDALAEAHGGFYFSGLEQSEAQNLDRLSEHYRAFVGSPAPVRFSTWEEALRALLALGDGRNQPIPVVIDELPYLLAGAPHLPSLLQDLLRPRSDAATRWRTRLILCGSALSVMRGLLAGSAPLRGRAALELMVHPFGYRDAAEYWGADELDVAVRLHALVGGTPAYRPMTGGGDAPSARRFDGWVADRLLTPASALYREGHVLLAEEPRVNDTALYFSVLAAVASGRTRRSEIAHALGKSDAAVNHPLAVLVEAGMLEVAEDPLRQRRGTFHLGEPVLRLHQLVIAPNATLLDRGRAAEIWRSVADTVSARIYGPHFEHLARQWTLDHASPETLRGTPSKVGTTTVACREHRSGHQLDVVCLESGANRASRILAIGEAKWSARRLDRSEVSRLEHVRDLLPDAGDAKLLLFAREGLDGVAARAVAGRADVEIVDLERMYHGN